MVAEIDGRRLFYKYAAGTGTPILLLHGWGADSRAVDCLFDLFQRRGRAVIGVDFFGFGKSDPPPETYTVFCYAESIERLLAQLQIDRVDVFGHSFGGRVGILLASTTTLVRRLALCGSAGLRPRRSLTYRWRVAVYKLKKRLRLNVSGAGSADYRALNAGMRGVFVRVVNRPLDRYARQIACPTLLLWGENDRETPPYMARKLERLIPDCGLVWIDGAGHYAYLDGFPIVSAALLSFFS